MGGRAVTLVVSRTRVAAFFMPLRRAGTARSAGVHYDPGSAKQRYALLRARETGLSPRHARARPAHPSIFATTLLSKRMDCGIKSGNDAAFVKASAFIYPQNPRKTHAPARNSPRRILADELSELNITPTELSRQISVPPNRISQIIQGKRAITGDTALRLGHWFQTSAQFWLNLQSAYDLSIATDAIGREVAALPTKAARRAR